MTQTELLMTARKMFREPPYHQDLDPERHGKDFGPSTYSAASAALALSLPSAPADKKAMTLLGICPVMTTTR